MTLNNFPFHLESINLPKWDRMTPGGKKFGESASIARGLKCSLNLHSAIRLKQQCLALIGPYTLHQNWQHWKRPSALELRELHGLPSALKMTAKTTIETCEASDSSSHITFDIRHSHRYGLYESKVTLKWIDIASDSIRKRYSCVNRWERCGNDVGGKIL